MDASADNIVVAKRHLRQDPFLFAKEIRKEIDYRAVPAGLPACLSPPCVNFICKLSRIVEILAEAGEKFDVVIGSEIIEHVSDPRGFVGVCASLLRVSGQKNLLGHSLWFLCTIDNPIFPCSLKEC